MPPENQDQETGTVQDDTSQGQTPLEESGTTTTDDISDSLASPFLEQIPEADRETVARYIKGWDAQVTNKFQQVHDTYKPYKDLGDVETLTQAQQLYNLIENDPKQVYDLLNAEFGTSTTPQGQTQAQPDADDIFSQLPEPVRNKFATLDKHDQVLEMMAQDYIQRQEREKEAQEEKELDAYMSNLQKKHGDFDQEYVLMKMGAGMDGDKAVGAWNSMIQARINKAGGANQNAPSVLSGGGGFATAGKDVNTLTSNETKALVAKMMEQMSRDNQ